MTTDSEPTFRLKDHIRKATLTKQQDQKCGECGMKEAFSGRCSRCHGRRVDVQTHLQQVEAGHTISWCGQRIAPPKPRKVASWSRLLTTTSSPSAQ
jgi:hypothetical protein